MIALLILSFLRLSRDHPQWCTMFRVQFPSIGEVGRGDMHKIPNLSMEDGIIPNSPIQSAPSHTKGGLAQVHPSIQEITEGGEEGRRKETKREQEGESEREREGGREGEG